MRPRGRHAPTQTESPTTDGDRDDIRQALHAKRQADGRLLDLVKRHFPVGTRAALPDGEVCEVAGVTAGGRVFLRRPNDARPGVGLHFAVEPDSLRPVLTPREVDALPSSADPDGWQRPDLGGEAG